VIKISISVVTYNSEKVIQACLDSLLNHTYSCDITIWIIDNQSQDHTVKIVQHYLESHKNIFFIQNPVNSGYGAGHNLALKNISSDYHVICNPDIEINHDTINSLASYMDKNPDIGILSPKFLNLDGSLQAINHRNPTFYDLALRRLIPNKAKPLFKKRLEYYEMLDRGYDEIYNVPFMSGAFMFCRTPVLKEIGGFDERYFLYFEDADLSREFQNRGLRTVYYPYATVIHGWERAAHKSLAMATIFIKNAFKYFNKWGYQFY
jgi:GT2 family glycosyltransferase